MTTPTTSNGIKPCPFLACGSLDVSLDVGWIEHEPDVMLYYALVRCNNCGAQGPQMHNVANAKTRAIDAWNTALRKP
jgi:Lar family restriction alleviation protein